MNRASQTLETMRRNGYDTSDSRYLTLLQLLKRHTQAAESAREQPTSNGVPPANPPQPSAQTNGYVVSPQSRKSNCTKSGMNRLLTNSCFTTGPFTQDQLIQLRAQILAY